MFLTRTHTFFSWTLLSLPALYLAMAYGRDDLSYGQSLSLSGDIAVKLLILAMAATPLRIAFPKSTFPKRLLQLRRAIGVASFGYAGFHLWIYLDRKADIARIATEGLRLDILTGWLAFFIFLPLALTSNQQSVSKLGRRWKKLHRWIYPAAALVLLHWVLTAYNPQSAYIHMSVLAALEGYRIWKQRLAK